MNIKLNINSTSIIPRIIVGIILILICLPLASTGLSEYIHYSEAYEETLAQDVEQVEVERIFIEGKEPMNNPEPFNNMLTSGRYDYYQSDYATGAMSFYNNTGIQLYFLEFDFGKEKFESEAKIKEQVKSKINETINLDNSLIIYEYSTDYDYDEDYYYYSNDNMYFGSNVAKYLSTEDVQMINYIIDNAYDLWEYKNRNSQIWITAGKNVAKGYYLSDYDENNSVSAKEDREFRLELYKDNMSFNLKMCIISSLIWIVGFMLILSGFLNSIKRRKLEAARVQAEIDYINARATKDILEADIKYVDDLVDKYIDEYEEE